MTRYRTKRAVLLDGEKYKAGQLLPEGTRASLIGSALRMGHIEAVAEEKPAKEKANAEGDAPNGDDENSPPPKPTKKATKKKAS